MDDEFLSKILLIAPWLIAVVVVLVLGLPTFHAVSTMDAALFQVVEQAKVGASTSELQSDALALVSQSLPLNSNSTTLFNPTNGDFSISSTNGPYETITMVYHEPVFSPFVSLFGLTGPTIPLHFSREVSLANKNDEGVNYQQ